MTDSIFLVSQATSWKSLIRPSFFHFRLHCPPRNELRRSTWGIARDRRACQRGRCPAFRSPARTRALSSGEEEIEEIGKTDKEGAGERRPRNFSTRSETRANGSSRPSQQQRPVQQQKGNTASSTQKNQPAKRRGSTSKQLPVRLAKESTDKPVKSARHKDNRQVALFGHLYGHDRRTTLDHASKDVHPAVLALGLKMSSYAICGSTARCVAMLLAFRQVIESYTTPPGTSLPRHLTVHLSPQIEYLVSCRPLATSMGNAIRWLKL